MSDAATIEKLDRLEALGLLIVEEANTLRKSLSLVTREKKGKLSSVIIQKKLLKRVSRIDKK